MPIQALDLAPALSAGGRVGAGAGSVRGRGFRVVGALHLALALMIVAQLGRIPVLAAGSKDAPLLINDLLIMFVVGVGGIAALRNRRLIVDRVGGFAIGFAAVGGISALLAIPRFGLSGAEFAFSIAYLFRWLAYFGVYLVAINFLRTADVPKVWRTMEMAVLVFSAFGIFQSFFLPDFAFIVHPDAVAFQDWDKQGHRLVSTFLDPNFAGAFIFMALLVSMARMAYGIEVPRWKLFVLFVALGLTISRGAIVGFVAGTMMIMYVRGISKGLLKFIGIGAAFGAVALPVVLQYAIAHNKFTIDTSAMTRVVGWLTGMEVFSHHPIIGVGFNTYGFVQSRYFPGGGELAQSSFGLDGGLLFVAVLTGVVGVAVYTGMIIAAVLRCKRLWRDTTLSRDDRAMALGVGAVTVAIVVHSFFLNTLFYPFLMEPLWVLWALTMVVARRERDEPEAESNAQWSIASPEPGARWV